MSVQDDKTTVSDGILLSDAAADKVRTLLEQEGRDDLALRVAVQPGGCSGLRYQLFFDERSLDGDVVKDFDGVKVVTDRMSSPYLHGASIDFVDTIEKQGFTIDNPNATGSCACGARSAKPEPVRTRARLRRLRDRRRALVRMSGNRRYCRGSGLPVVASTTFRSPSGFSSVTVTDISCASMMHAWPGWFGVSVIFTRTDSADSRAEAE